MLARNQTPRTRMDENMATGESSVPAAPAEQPALSGHNQEALVHSMREEPLGPENEASTESETVQCGSVDTGPSPCTVQDMNADKADSSKDLRKDICAMNDKLNQVLQELGTIKVGLSDVIRFTQGRSSDQRLKETAADLEEQEQNIAMFKSGRSLAHLDVATENCLGRAPGSNALHCKICVPKFMSSVHVREGSTVFGVFKYDFSLGSSFARSEKVPMMFRNLKTAVQNHFSSKKHHEKSAAAQTNAAVLKGRFNKNVQISKRVLRTGYYVVKNSLSHASYEDLVVLLYQLT